MRLHHLVAASALLVTSAPVAVAQLSVAREDATVEQPFLTVGLGRAIDLDGDRAIAADSGSLVIFSPTTARVFERDASGAWVEDGLLVSTDPGSNLGFGAAVALDGDRALVGEPGGAFDAGKVFVFERAGGAWSMSDVFAAPTPVANDRFGLSIDLVGDRAIVGAPGANSDRGAVHVYDRDPVTGAWNWTATLDLAGASPVERLGTEVELVGGRVITSAPSRDVGAVVGAGSVHVFEEQSPGTWSQVQVLTSAAPGSNHSFGSSFDVRDDRLVVGAPGDDLAGTLDGAAHVFELDTSGVVWLPVDVLRAPPTTAAGFFPSLNSVALGEDSVVVGHSSTTGAVHVFERTTAGTFRPAVRLEPANLPAPSSVALGLGTSLAADGDRLLAGVPGGGQPGLLGPSGVVYEFGLGTLYHSASTVDLPGPAAQKHFLRATDARAGDFYYFLGTMTGTSPGTPDPVTGINIPINVDAYTLFLINNGSPGLTSPFGVLDGNGEAQSAYVLPPGTSAAFAGLELHHCYLVIDSTTFVGDEASNAVRVRVQ